MYTIIIALLGAVGVGIWAGWPVTKFYNFDWEHFWIPIVMIPLITMMMIGCIRVIRIGFDNFIDREYRDQPITSLINKAGSQVNGSFILGCGSVKGSSTDYYIAYANCDKGNLRIKVDAYRTYVIESDSDAPVIKDYWVRSYRTGYKSKWIFNSKKKYNNWRKNYGEKTVVVPTNTIYKEFAIKN